MPIHLMCTSLGRGRKLGYLETDMQRMCKLHRNSGPSQKLIFFPHEHYYEMALNKMTLFGDLLYRYYINADFLT